jgi:DNA primase
LAEHPERPTHLVLDLDPPEGDGFAAAVQGARLVREVLDGAGLACVVKTSGAKGVHVFVPVAGIAVDDAAAATRAIAARAEALDPDVATTAFVKEERGGKVFVDATRVGSATVAAAFSPRVRPGAPVSFPVRWDDLDAVAPSDFTIATVLDHLDDAGPWLGDLPDELRQQAMPGNLVEEGHQITPGRVEAMHAGKRRKRAAEHGA